MKNQLSPEEYWAGIAEEVGEEIIAYALAQVVVGEARPHRGMFADKPEWGLVFLTGSTLYVERGSTPNWLQRLFSSRSSEETRERMRIPLDSISALNLPPPVSRFRQFLAGPEVAVHITCGAEPGTVRLVLDRRGQNDRKLLDHLARLPGTT